jgi:hypothetical protein
VVSTFGHHDKRGLASTPFEVSRAFLLGTASRGQGRYAPSSSRSNLQVDDATAESDRDRLRTIPRIELTQDVFDMNFDRFLRDR